MKDWQASTLKDFIVGVRGKFLSSCPIFSYPNMRNIDNEHELSLSCLDQRD